MARVYAPRTAGARRRPCFATLNVDRATRHSPIAAAACYILHDVRTARRVLILSQEAKSRAELAGFLEDAGFNTVRVDKSNEVAAHIGDGCLILVDGVTSEAGLDTLRTLRADPTVREQAIVLITDASDPASLEEAFEIGADDLVRRPFPPAELTARVGAQFRMRRFVDALSDEKRDAQVMLELTQALASSLDFREILYTVVRRIADVVHVSRVSIVLAPEPSQKDVGYVVVASDDEQLSNLRLDLSKYPEIQQVLRTREPLTISDATTHPVLDGVRGEVDRRELSAMSLFPIVWEERAIGVLFLRARAERGELSRRETHLCQIVANATAVALNNARVMQSLRDHTQQISFARFEAERRMHELERYADLFASAAEGIAVVDADGQLLFANPRTFEVIGGDVSELKGKKVRELLHPDDAVRADSLWEGFTRGEYPRGVDMRLQQRGTGSWRVCSCSFASLPEGEGAVLISFQDVTEQRQTEAELVKTMEFLESLIDASVDGIVAADMSGNLILFNQGAERIYGHSAADVVGRLTTKDLYPPGMASDVMRRIRSEKYGGKGRLAPTNMHALGKTGELIPMRLSAAMIYERGEAVATFGIFTDLREKLRVEERLAEAQQKLANSEKQALIAELAGTAAHELNQPLTSVMAYAELLKRKLDSKSSEHRAATIMVREAERMADIVRKIGKMTKYETKSYVGEQKILDLDKASGGDGDHKGAGEGPMT